MDGGFVPTLANTDEGDLRRFYGTLSRCVGRDLDPRSDPVSLHAPAGWPARSASGFMALCRIGPRRLVIFKRCLDDPDYIRRELLIASVKSALGWVPRYNVLGIGGVRLRGAGSGANPRVFAGWEGRDAVVIDAGDPTVAKDMGELEAGDVRDLVRFCRDWGGWTAFNYLFGVRDRSALNFMFLTDAQVIHSIDNEEGPLGHGAAAMASKDVITFMRHNLVRLLGGAIGDAHARAFREGFLDGWGRIGSAFPSLPVPDGPERDHVGTLLSDDPSSPIRMFLYGG